MAGPLIQLDPWDQSSPASDPASEATDNPTSPVWELWHAEGAGLERDACADERLAELAAAIGPLRRVMAAVAARVVETRCYERLCYARLADYARERPGISVRQVQDLARVHRAMVAMPVLEAALLANRLPWSKLRLVARVATAAEAEAWVERARGVTTRHLEQIVREASEGESDAPGLAEPERRVTTRCTPAVREKWSLVHEMAERVAGQRLCAGQTLELVAAEVFSETSLAPAMVRMLEEDVPERRSARPTRTDQSPPARALARGLPDAVAQLAAGLEEADAVELDRRLCLALRLEQTLDAAMAPLLRVVTSAEYEWSTQYTALETFAREQLGMSGRKARALLRLERAGDVCPALREAYRSGRLSWAKAQCLLPLLLLDLEGDTWRPAWVAWAQRVTVRRLETDVERALLLRAGHHLAWQRCKDHPERAQDPIPPGERQMCAHGVDTEATEEIAIRVPHDVASLFVAVRETLRARMGPVSDGEVLDAMLDRALAAWTSRDPAARRPDPVIERDGYRCVVPGCTSRRSLHDHHVVFRSAGGGEAQENRTTLCAFHHLRCLHQRRMRLYGRAPDAIVIELPLARYGSGDVLLASASPSA